MTEDRDEIERRLIAGLVERVMALETWREKVEQEQERQKKR
ncbi:MAG: hypothetical protein ACR2OR_08935 [Hyphomicrobiales bacterium]